jgi:hypothetical protein
MSADELPPWEQEPSPFAPGPGQQARAIALYNTRIDDTPANYERVLLDYTRDLLHNSASPQSAVWALVEYGARSLLAHQGQELTRARIRQDLSVAREQALEEEDQ